MTKKKTTKKPAKKKILLPNRLSDLIDLAVTDLEAVEKSKKYRVEMDYVFHEPEGDKCAVCFAGSVMAKTCKLKPTQSGGDFTAREMTKFLALDQARQGYLGNAAISMFGNIDEYGESARSIKSDKVVSVLDKLEMVDVPIVEYSDCPTIFKSEMRGIAARLRYAGL